jgi:diaminopimelate epimerase
MLRLFPTASKNSMMGVVMARLQTAFTKMHGLGNDFVVIDALPTAPKDRKSRLKVTPAVARQIGDRRFGVGFDQLLWLKPGKKASKVVQMVILNPDGSQAEMCGNGIRAAALYLKRHHRPYKSAKTLEIDTLGGRKRVEFTSKSQMKVDMERPLIERRGENLSGPHGEVTFDRINMGNPHAVVWVEQLSSAQAEERGPWMEKHPAFPERTNVEFVEKVGPQQIRVRVWERGAGFTLACGTGACASAVSGIAAGKLRSPVQVELPGGRLTIHWSGHPEDPVFMEGPATEVFLGQLKNSRTDGREA